MRRIKKVSGAKKCIYNNIKFDSRLERDRYILLKEAEKQGLITNLELQKPFDLIPTQPRGDNYVPSISSTKNIRKTQYYSDFTYYRIADKKWIINDAKGRAMDVYKLKTKLVVQIYCNGKGWTFLETYKDSKRNNFKDL